MVQNRTVPYRTILRSQTFKVLVEIPLLYLKLFQTLNIIKKYFKTFINNKSGKKLEIYIFKF